MKKIKIFPKTFLYTLGLMLFIIAIAHVLLYLFTPQVMIDVSITPHEEWSLSTGFNVEQYVKQTIIKVLSFSSVCCIIISVICWFWFSRKITIPIKHIQTMTEQMARMKKNAVCTINSKDEIGVLADNINCLYKSLLSAIDNLEIEKQNVSEIKSSSEVKKLSVTVSVFNMLQLFLIGFVIIMLSVVASSLTVMRFKPREILSKWAKD